MALLYALLGLAALCAIMPTRADTDKKVFCYYSSFAQNRQGVGKFLPEDIDPYLCTHIIFAFVDINRHGTDLRAFNRNDKGTNGLYARAMALKESNPALKVLLAVGGWQIGSKPFMPMISSQENMRRWVKNVIKYLREFNFDGFDMDWEFPATRGSPAEDKYRYTKLMKGLYEAFAEEARSTGREKLLLTMATASGTYFINTSYEPKKIIQYMDFMLLMTYNYHGQWEKRTGHHSPLWKHRNDPPGEQSELSQNWSIDYWLDIGVPKEKLVVGLATYGMSYTLADPSRHGVHAPANGGGHMGKFTKETGIMAYYEICLNMANNGWKTGWIDDQGAPYAYGGDQWVGFDNVDSIKMKADNIMKRGLAGAFVWSVEMDDFNGVCGGGKYPLLSTVTRVLKPYQGVAKIAHAETAPKVTTKAASKVTAKATVKATPKVTAKATVKAASKVTRKVTPKAALKIAPTTPLMTTSKTTAAAQPMFTPKITRAPSRGVRVTKWGKPTWRPRNTSGTKAPWWKRTTPAPVPTTTTTTTTTPVPAATDALTARPTRSPFTRSAGHNLKSTPSPRMQQKHDSRQLEITPDPQENSVHQKRRFQGNGRHHKSNRRQDRKQQSSAGALAGDTVFNCSLYGSGLFAHPGDCEKFVMCLPGAWMDYPPHIMDCPAGTRFDDLLKVCNHADSVECLD